MSTAASTNTSSKKGIQIPTPKIHLGADVTRQYTNNDNIGSAQPFKQTDFKQIGISFEREFESKAWLDNTPMIFLNVWKNTKKGSRRVKITVDHGDPMNGIPPTYGFIYKRNVGKYVHISQPTSLNRTHTNYGGNGAIDGNTISEIDFTKTKEGQIELFNLIPSTLFKSWKDFPLNKKGALQFQLISRYVNDRMIASGIGSTTPYWRHKINFQFAIIDPNNSRKLLFSKPSQEIIIEPKMGMFNDNEVYLYEFQLNKVD